MSTVGWTTAILSRLVQPTFTLNVSSQSRMPPLDRLVSGARRHDHITPVLTKLHWLPVRKRCSRLWVVLVCKCLNSTAPGYLSELCVPTASASGRQHLRSASTGLLQVPRAPTMIGQWSFAVSGPSLWNSLPAALRKPETTLHTFK